MKRDIRKKDSLISFVGSGSNELLIQYNKQSVVEILIQGAVKTTIQILYDKGVFDNYINVDEVLKKFCLLQGVEPIYRK